MASPDQGRDRDVRAPHSTQSETAPASTAPRPPRRAPSPRSTREDGLGEPRVTKLLVFVVENHSFDEMQSQMPFVRSLAQRYGYASGYTAITHPSLPNYLAMAAGTTFGLTDDDGPEAHALGGSSIFGDAIASGKTARLYAEAMANPCQHDSSGTYAVKHNPWAYFPEEASMCARDDVPLPELQPDVLAGGLPAVGMVIPDLCNDAHDCSLSQADNWLSANIGLVMSGPDWKSGDLAVVVTADEDDRAHGNHVLTLVAHPSLDHVVVSSPLDHYSLARAYADVAQVPPLGNAATAPDLLTEFGLPD